MQTYLMKLITIIFLSLALMGFSNQYIDNDNDGYPQDIDCDDNDPTVWFIQGFYLDEDHDGFGTGEIIQEACWGREWYHQYPLDERSFNNDDCNIA